MSKPRHSLDEIQHWMQAVITHPAGPRVALESTEATQHIAVGPSQIERVILRSNSQTSLERLQIYYHAYYARLLDCLREEYSVLAHALGQELFDSFAVGYLQEYPSQSYTLGRLGARFPEFLAATRPAPDSSDAGDADWPALMIDMARLERVVNEVFDGPGTEGLATLDPSRLREIPPEDYATARLIPAPCLRVMQFAFPLNDFFAAAVRKEAVPFPIAQPSYLAITRRDYRVQRFELSREQYLLLESLRRGTPLGPAIEHATHELPLTDAQLASQLETWFRAWTAAGFFIDFQPA
jgi:hypothetical protein